MSKNLGFDAEDVQGLSRAVFEHGFTNPDMVLKMTADDLAACGLTLGAVKHFERARLASATGGAAGFSASATRTVTDASPARRRRISGLVDRLAPSRTRVA